MNWPPTSPLRARLPLLLAAAGLLALATTAAQAADKAQFSAPANPNDSSLAPLKPSDKGNEFDRLFERPKAQLPGFDLPPSSDPKSKQTMDPKAQRRLKEQMDKKRNWMSNDTQGKAGEGKDKGKGKDGEKADFQPDRPRTLLEKQIQDEERRATEQAEKNRQDTKAAERDRPDDGTGDADDRLETKVDRPDRDSPDRARPANGFERATFSDPFSSPFAPRPQDQPGSIFGAPAAAAESRAEFARPSSAERVEQMVSGPSPTGGAAAARSDPGAFREFGASGDARARAFQGILDGPSARASSSTAAAANAFTGPAAAQRSFAPPVSVSLPSAGAGFLNPAPSQFTPSRASGPAMRPQPGVLPLPTLGR